MIDLFICALCKKIFRNVRSDEEMKKEYVDTFGVDVAAQDTPERVCGSCFKLIDPKRFPETVQKVKDKFTKKPPQRTGGG